MVRRKAESELAARSACGGGATITGIGHAIGTATLRHAFIGLGKIVAQILIGLLLGAPFLFSAEIASGRSLIRTTTTPPASRRIRKLVPGAVSGGTMTV